MKILNLKLLNFRNYEKLELSFNPSKNIIIGQNGMGKTNIVEAIRSEERRVGKEFRIGGRYRWSPYQ